MSLPIVMEALSSGNASHAAALSTQMRDLSRGFMTNGQPFRAFPAWLLEGDEYYEDGDEPPEDEDDPVPAGPEQTVTPANAPVNQIEPSGGGKGPFIEMSAVKSLNPTTQRIVRKLPEELRYRSKDASFLYPGHLADLYDDYRGRDSPDAEWLSAPAPGACTSRADRSEQSVRLYFRDSAYGPVAAGSLGAGEASKDSASVRILAEYDLSTQLPMLRLTVECGAAAKRVEVRIYANCLARRKYAGGAEEVGLFLRTTHNPGLLENLGSWGIDPDLGDGWGLAEVRMTLISIDNGKLAQVPFGAPGRRPLFTNFSMAGQHSLLMRAEGKSVWDPSLTPGEWTLVLLVTSNNVSVFRAWPASMHARHTWRRFDSFWGAAMRDACTEGNFPYYQRCAQLLRQDPADINFNVALALPPRHLVQKWRITYDLDHRPISVEPEQWKSYTHYDSSYPDTEIKILASRIGIDRSRQYAHAAVLSAWILS